MYGATARRLSTTIMPKASSMHRSDTAMQPVKSTFCSATSFTALRNTAVLVSSPRSTRYL